MSLNSFNSGSLVEVVPESEEVPDNCSDKMGTLTQSTTLVNSASASSVDLFQAHATSSSPSIDLFQSSTVSASSAIQHKVPPTDTASSLDFWADFPQHSHTTPEKTLPEPSIPKNEGWATFDSPQSTEPTPAAESLSSVEVHPNDAYTAKGFDLFPSFVSNMDWPASEKHGSQDTPSDAPYAWDAALGHPSISEQYLAFEVLLIADIGSNLGPLVKQISQAILIFSNVKIQFA
ncbi:hypothetical protein SAY87_030078 [Trapa incisa]|uniref:Uncharacterized protein n=1 Tax=Trapa incisa TaxID=236973 RepID=A0AAN7KC42_9MYRT|nr:hypothetical protein SAY87_030078 [Trapa incisa]